MFTQALDHFGSPSVCRLGLVAAVRLAIVAVMATINAAAIGSRVGLVFAVEAKPAENFTEHRELLPVSV
jgi:hypothetical protein